MKGQHSPGPGPRMDALRLVRLEGRASIPEQVEHGVLYVSEEFRLAIHLCACGCGGEAVTPLREPGDDSGWTLTEPTPGAATLRPSIGHMHWPCRSHYWITAGRIEWL